MPGTEKLHCPAVSRSISHALCLCKQWTAVCAKQPPESPSKFMIPRLMCTIAEIPAKLPGRHDAQIIPAQALAFRLLLPSCSTWTTRAEPRRLVAPVARDEPTDRIPVPSIPPKPPGISRRARPRGCKVSDQPPCHKERFH